jgi:rod shape-determining protein MreD
MTVRGRTLRVHERVAFFGALGFAVIGALIYAAPVGVAGFDAPMPWLPLLPVFFWGLLRPDLVRAVAAFAVGLFQDIVSGGPLGVWALTYLVAFAAIAPQRDALAGQSPSAVWIGFALFVVLAAAVAFGAGWLASRFRPDPALEGLGIDPATMLERDIRPGPALAPLLLEAGMTALLGPLAARPLGGFARIGALGRAAS